MPRAATAGVFREFVLKYHVPGAQDGTDAFGNPTFATEERQQVVTFDAYLFAQLRRQPGIDPKEVVGTGRAVDPAVFPPEVTIGTAFEMEWGGVKGTLTITNIQKDALEILDRTLGQQFVGSWIPDG